MPLKWFQNQDLIAKVELLCYACLAEGDLVEEPVRTDLRDNPKGNNKHMTYKMAARATCAPRVDARRRQLIIDAAYRHAVHKAKVGQRLAIEGAIAEMIGSSQFLTLCLSKSRARMVIVGMLDTL